LLELAIWQTFRRWVRLERQRHPQKPSAALDWGYARIAEQRTSQRT